MSSAKTGDYFMYAILLKMDSSQAAYNLNSVDVNTLDYVSRKQNPLDLSWVDQALLRKPDLGNCVLREQDNGIFSTLRGDLESCLCLTIPVHSRVLDHICTDNPTEFTGLRATDRPPMVVPKL
jgi:hypothetical protein